MLLPEMAQTADDLINVSKGNVSTSERILRKLKNLARKKYPSDPPKRVKDFIEDMDLVDAFFAPIEDE